MTERPGALPRPGEVHVWSARLDVGADELSRLAGLLSDEERQRAARFRRAEDVRGFTAARGHVRRLLADYLATSPGGLDLRTGTHGKPFLHGREDVTLRFNVSHSRSTVLIAAASDREVGVDVEWLAPPTVPARPPLSMDTAVFHRSEREALAGLARDEQDRAAVQLWTRKEAVLKGVGLGLVLSPERVVALGDVVRLDPADVPGAEPQLCLTWTVRTLDAGGGFAAAVALAGLGAPPPPALRSLAPA